MAILRQSEVRKVVKTAGRRAGKDFLSAFEHHCNQKLLACVAMKNGGKITLDSTVVNFVFGGLK